MAEKNVNIRLVATGGGQLRAELMEVGAAGDAAFGKVKASADSASAGLKKFGAAANDAGRAGSSMGGGMRSTMQQLSQVGQQTAATGQFVQALAVQLPDLALGFGPVGMAIGTVTGLLLSMAPSLLGAGDAAKEYKDRLKGAEDASKALSAAVKDAAIPLYELKKLYGDSADEVERLNKNQLEAAKGAAATKLRDVVSALGLSQGSFDRPIQGPNQPGMFDWLLEGRTVVGRQSEYEATVSSIAAKFGVLTDSAVKVAAALEDVTKAKTPDEAIAAADKLQSTLIEVTGSADAAAKKFPDLWNGAKDAADLAKQNVQSLTEATAGLVSGFDAGISKLDQLRRGMESWGAGGIFDKVSGWVTGFKQQTLPQYSAANKGILDLIGWAEGTDRGRGYNETLDYGKWTGGPVNLTSMSLKDVRALQRRMLTPENIRTYGGKGSSAVGRYQIVGTTLDGLMKRLNLTGDELFDEAMQDRLAMELVRQRAKQGTKAGWDAEWQSFQTKGVSLAAINAALGQKSVGVDPSVAAQQKQQNDELKRGLDLRADFLTSLQDQADATRLEAQVTGQSVYEQVRLRTELSLTQQAKAKGIDLNERIGESEKTYGQAIKETAANMAAAAQEQAARESQADAAVEAAKRSAEAMRKFQDDLKQGFANAFQSVIDGTKSVSEAFRSMIAQMLAQKAASGLSNAFGGLFDSIFGGGDPLASALTSAGLSNVTPVSPLSGVLGAAQQVVKVTVGVDQKSGNLTAFTDQRVSAGISQANKMLPSKVAQINRDPLRRG